MPKVNKVKTRKTRNRLAALRLDDPKSLPNVDASDGVNRREFRKVRKAYRTRSKRADQPKPKAPAQVKPEVADVVKQRYDSIRTIPNLNLEDGVTRPEKRAVNQAWRRQGRPVPFDPTAPLTGRAMADETAAATRLKYGEAEDALQSSIRNQRQTTANTATYYDDYRQALQEATGRISATYQQAASDSQAASDRATQQDVAAAQQRDAQDSRQSELLGRGQTQTNVEFAAASNRQRLGNEAAARAREQGANAGSYMEKRGATAVLSKAEAVGRQNARMSELEKAKRRLKQDKGDFKLDFRNKARESEREWSAIQKEFGLKKQELKATAKSDRADRRLEQQKLEAQKIVARIYASADKAGARAQVRVARLQLKKGKISRHQFRTIRNIYDGLPTHKTVDVNNHYSGGGKGSGGSSGTPTKGPQGSGANGRLQPWERDKMAQARTWIGEAHPTPDARGVTIAKLVKAGIPRRLAAAAWRNYMKNYRNTQTGPQGLPTANGHQ